MVNLPKPACRVSCNLKRPGLSSVSKTNMAEKYVLELRKKVETLRETDSKVGEIEIYIN
jgi:hypothetical protein